MPGRQITANFNEDELRCKCGCGLMLFTDAAVEHLQELRDHYGQPIHVNSGYRCPDHNAAVSSTGRNGPHTQTGGDNITVDVGVRGGDALRLVAVAYLLGWRGVGVRQKGSSRFIHLDRLPNGQPGPRPWIWSY